jgi:hypothetical protein
MFKRYYDVLLDVKTYLKYVLALYQDSVLKILSAEHSDTGMVEEENTVKASVKNARETF